MFSQLIEQLNNSCQLKLKITGQQYTMWQKHHVWHALQGLSMGRSFCEHFDIKDYRLKYGTNEQVTRIITREYVKYD
jgi:hypothetical protein